MLKLTDLPSDTSNRALLNARRGPVRGVSLGDIKRMGGNLVGNDAHP